jgi:hypothetical protein
MDEIVNRVAQSGIISLDLEEVIVPPRILEVDLADFLEEGLLLREKPFRALVKEFSPEVTDWDAAAVFCSTDAILPQWAEMVVTERLAVIGLACFSGTKDLIYTRLYLEKLAVILNDDKFSGARVVLKGCGKGQVPPAAYSEATRLLIGRVKSLLYGEPCSTVPIYKNKL